MLLAKGRAKRANQNKKWVEKMKKTKHTLYGGYIIINKTN